MLLIADVEHQSRLLLGTKAPIMITQGTNNDLKYHLIDSTS